ncbi:hypothetical protein NKG94_21360 [Micromonospora sp. M12]
MLGDVVFDLDRLGLLLPSGGADCVFPPGFTGRDGEPLPLIVRKSDGGYGYPATDLPRCGSASASWAPPGCCTSWACRSGSTSRWCSPLPGGRLAPPAGPGRASGLRVHPRCRRADAAQPGR